MLKARLYQEKIAAQCVKENTLVVLPTGLGKTFLSFLVLLHQKNKNPTQKILVLAPTRPLVNQHKETFDQLFAEAKIEMKTAVFTGTIPPKTRQELFSSSQLIFSTPQGLENDILANRIQLQQISLIVFDEAHRATGDYSYVWIAKQYSLQQKNGLVLGLTASPGSDKEQISEVMQNLNITHIEFREKTSPDVAPYVQISKITNIEVDLPEEFIQIQELMQKSMATRIKQLHALGFLQQKKSPTKVELLQFIGSCQKAVQANEQISETFTAISLASQLLKISHGLELLESQGIPAIRSYISDLEHQAEQKASKGVVQLLQDPFIRLTMLKVKDLASKDATHPKLFKVLDILKNHITKKPTAKFIIFSQYRDTLKMLTDYLKSLPSIKSQIFVGQAKKKDTGMSQKEQLQTLIDFKEGKFNCLCMSSVGEEGLDIPSVDVVLFYEPIPSAIRSIQRRGRTGRHEEGAIYMLIAKNTRDVAYKWIAYKKEKNMYEHLKNIQGEKNLKDSVAKQQQVKLNFEARMTVDTQKSTETVSQTTPLITNPIAVSTTANEQVLISTTEQLNVPVSKTTVAKVFVDTREMKGSLVKALYQLPIELVFEQLTVGDYRVSQDIAIEYKTAQDFVNSILDGRLMTQLPKLKSSILKPLVIIEGNIFGLRNIHPNSLYGMLTTIMISYQIPVLFTQTSQEAANCIYLLARREQQSSKDFSAHASLKPSNVDDQLLYTVSSIPGVGTSLAKRLLEEFSTLHRLANSSVEQLSKVENIATKKASHIFEFFHKEFKK